mmetsp:Transcript_23181/g.58755  ORF Transcript_23181/g.58755 Transcript_23181/m.58755 type:complete len:381 (-) Transcript_23181:222-1364(-)
MSLSPLFTTLPSCSESEHVYAIGDIHGCADELELLIEDIKAEVEKAEMDKVEEGKTEVEKVKEDRAEVERVERKEEGEKRQQKKHLLVSVGDIVAKGPDSSRCIDLLMREDAVGVLGNHDVEVLRCRAHIEEKGECERVVTADVKLDMSEREEKGGRESEGQGEKGETCLSRLRLILASAKLEYDPAKIPTFALPSHHCKLAKSLNSSQLLFLLRLPLTIYFPLSHLTVVHAGVVGGVELHMHGVDTLTKVRGVRCVQKGKGDREGEGEGTLQVFERDVCRGEEREGKMEVVVSSEERVTRAPPSSPPSPLTHWAQDWEEVDKSGMSIVYGHDAYRRLEIRKRTFGLDNGCVYGGTLAAMHISSKRLLHIEATAQYCTPK